MKKLFLVFLVTVMALGLVSCGGSASSTAKKADFVIGICNYVDDASLNQIEENIKNRLQEIATENNLTFEIKAQNASGDASVMNQIINDYITDKVDLMIGIATPVAITMQSMTEENRIPVIFSAVSDPVGSGLVESLEKPGANITGTSDYLNTEAILNIMLANHPEAKKIGLLYDVSQDASTAPVKEAKEFLSKKGIQVVEACGTNVSEIQLSASSLISQGVDAVFTPTDNTVMTAELSIYQNFIEAGIPHYTGANSFALNGAFLGYGVDYANLGIETANMVKDILIDKKDPADVAVKTFDNGIATVNTETAEALGYEMKNLETLFKPYCNKIETIVTGDAF